MTITRGLHLLARRRLLAGCALIGLAAALTSPGPASAQSAPAPERHAYFGDLHLHSGFSLDAYALGARVFPDDSFNFAKGLPVSFLGRSVRRKAPLDFLALTDHAEYLGVAPELTNPASDYSGTGWEKAFNSPDPAERAAMFRRLVGMAEANERIAEFEKPEALTSLWRRYVETAERHNDPGTFTTFIAFEWTSAPGNRNLHRCVIFKDKGPDFPFTSLDSQDPEALWTYLESMRAAGRDVLAIPHNGNLSNGLMFARDTGKGAGIIDAAYAERRMANEPLFEIVQEKGSSDTHPQLSPNDEFAAFEIYPYMLGSTTPATIERASYLRKAYGMGQEIAENIGVNPFKYGIEGGTDNHSGMSSTEEFNFLGTPIGAVDRKADLLSTAVLQNPGGLTGVWAEENTRASLFDALRRKETFGTSGVRISLRLFAGWDYPADLTEHPDWPAQAYAGGVAMGGDLTGWAPGKMPTFAVQVVKDPDSAGLDRVQMIKVSTKDGVSREEVIDLFWSGSRSRDPATGKVPPADGAGAGELKGTWTDRNFDPAARSTYYIRALEVETPRWSTDWAREEGVAAPGNVAGTIQERAWSSPIWYVAQ